MALPSCKRDKSASSSSGINIAVIPKGTTHEYWKSIQAGAEQAGKDLHVNILWKGPMKESDRAQQQNIVEQFVSDRVSAIVLAPLDDTALLQPVQEADAAKIPVVIFDSALKGQLGKDFISFVATDNHKGGEMAGEELARLLNGKGKVVLLRYEEGSASTMAREDGFLEAIAKHPGLQMLVKNRYGGTDADESQKAAMNMLDQLKEADGIFCPNESSTLGMLRALQDAQIAGKKKFVGFDASKDLTDGLRSGQINALVVQDPYKMGYDGVKVAVEAIQHKPYPTHEDTGVRLITAGNLNDPVVKKMIGE